MTPRILICTGEASGDLHGANLARSLLALEPAVRVYGMGGVRMREAGVDLRVDSAALGIVGIVEVFSGILRLRRAFNRMVSAIKELAPDVVVLIDSPEFNMRLAPHARRMGVPVVYYIAPQVWAWRRHRIRKLARFVDRMLVTLPFEEEMYRGAGMDVRFVGHPLLDQVMSTQDRPAFLAHLGLDPRRPVVSLCPGSRTEELDNMGAVLAACAECLSRAVPDVAFLVPVAPTLSLESVRRCFTLDGQSAPITFVRDRTYDALASSDVAIAAAGTLTLEAALLGTPTVVMYRTSWLNYMLGQMLIRVDHIALANVVARRRVFPELIQREASPENLAREASDLLLCPPRAAAVRQELARVRALLGAPGASSRAAAAVLELVDSRRAAGSGATA
jgi:lipid-A-disaccharide synthase